jgi:hypothetical protein
MYAMVVKNSQGTWDVWRTIGKFSADSGGRQQRLDLAFSSGLPITGIILTPYEASARSGAIWDGTGFTGGVDQTIPTDTDWSGITLYGYLCDNIILVVFYSDPFAVVNEQMLAIFDGETTMIEIPDGANVSIGDIWDGTGFVSV